MFYNRKNIELINEVKAKAEKKGLTFAQTSSRLNGNYLSAARIYKNKRDKGKTSKAIWIGREPRDFVRYLEE